MRRSVLALAVGFLACQPARPRWPSATMQTWTVLRAALEEQRRARPRTPWAAGLRITLHDPGHGRVVDGRGALAVAPGLAVRMVLIGAAGATMLDAWVTPTRWRIAVPPLDLVRRGGLDEPSDLPVGFLRWWFLTPFSGTLVAAATANHEPLWLIRTGGAVVELRERLPTSRGERTCLRATRRAFERAETVDECRDSNGSGDGDSARYLDERSGLEVDLRFESFAKKQPTPEAFEDPDVARSGT